MRPQSATALQSGTREAVLLDTTATCIAFVILLPPQHQQPLQLRRLAAAAMGNAVRSRSDAGAMAAAPSIAIVVQTTQLTAAARQVPLRHHRLVRQQLQPQRHPRPPRLCPGPLQPQQHQVDVTDTATENHLQDAGATSHAPSTATAVLIMQLIVAGRLQQLCQGLQQRLPHQQQLPLI